METSLHRTLKERYAAGGSGRPEVVVERFRVDAVDESGRLVEVQSGALGPLRGKCHQPITNKRASLLKAIVRCRNPACRANSTASCSKSRFILAFNCGILCIA